MAMVLPAPAVTTGVAVPGEVVPEVVVKPGRLPVPAGVEADWAEMVPLGKIGAAVARVLAVVQVGQATEATVVTGLVMVQGQSVMVKVVAWEGILAHVFDGQDESRSELPPFHS